MVSSIWNLNGIGFTFTLFSNGYKPFSCYTANIQSISFIHSAGTKLKKARIIPSLLNWLFGSPIKLLAGMAQDWIDECLVYASNWLENCKFYAWLNEWMASFPVLDKCNVPLANNNNSLLNILYFSPFLCQFNLAEMERERERESVLWNLTRVVSPKSISFFFIHTETFALAGLQILKCMHASLFPCTEKLSMPFFLDKMEKNALLVSCGFVDKMPVTIFWCKVTSSSLQILG